MGSEAILQSNYSIRGSLGELAPPATGDSVWSFALPGAPNGNAGWTGGRVFFIAGANSNLFQMTFPDIVVVGSLNADLVASVARFPNPGETITGERFETFCGGKGANQAYAAGRLGASVAMIGQVGADSFGDRQLENLALVGVGTNSILRDPDQPTGTAIIGVEANGENRIIVIPGANGSFTPERLAQSADLIRRAKWILLQLEIPAATVGEALRIAREGRACVILDPAPASALPDEWLRGLHYLTPNLAELALLTGVPLNEESDLTLIARTARRLCARGVERVIAKLGSRGALLVTDTDEIHWPTPRVKPVDTTAAGDCFNGVFAAELSSGKTETEAGAFAVAAAALSVTRAGAQASMPERAEVETFLRTSQQNP